MTGREEARSNDPRLAVLGWITLACASLMQLGLWFGGDWYRVEELRADAWVMTGPDSTLVIVIVGEFFLSGLALVCALIGLLGARVSGCLAFSARIASLFAFFLASLLAIGPLEASLGVDQ